MFTDNVIKRFATKVVPFQRAAATAALNPVETLEATSAKLTDPHQRVNCGYCVLCLSTEAHRDHEVEEPAVSHKLLR